MTPYLLILAASSVSALGLQEDEATPTKQDLRSRQALSRGPWGQFNQNVRSFHHFRADLDGDEGDVEVSTVEGTLGLRLPLGASTALIPSLGAGLRSYDFSNDTVLIPGLPADFENMHRIRFGLGFASHLERDWMLLGNVGTSLSYEGGASTSNASTYSGTLGVRWNASESVTLGLGLVYASRLDARPYFFPLPTIDWRISERLTLKTSQGFALTYDVDAPRTLTLGGAIRFAGIVARLDDRPGLEDGVFEDRRIALDLQVTYRPIAAVEALVFIGADAWQEFRIYDDTGDRVAKAESKPSPVVGLSVTIKF